MTSEQRKRFIDFDPKVNMGHILTLICIIAALFFWKADVETSIDQVDHRREIGDMQLQSQSDLTTQALRGVVRRIELLEAKGGDQ